VPAGALSFYSDDACQSAVSTASLSPDASTFDFFVRGDTAGTSSVRAEAGSTLAPGLLPLTVSP
jgi:hypothetical protein